MNELDQKMDSVQKDNEERENLKEALESRRRILGFNDELLQGFQHSQEMFGNVLDDITYYDDYCRNHPEFVNQRAILAESNIKRVYQECMEKRIFL